MDCSPPGSPIHGISQARILEWVCHILLQEIFPTQGSNPGLLRWEMNSLLLSPQLSSRSVVSDSLWPHEWQHARLPCLSPSSWICSSSCPLSQWCHPTISSSVPFSSCPQSFPESGSFPMIWLFTSGGQSIVASASASDHSVNIQGWFPLGWTGLISLLSKGLSSLLQYHSLKASILWHSAFFMVQLLHWKKSYLWLSGTLSAKYVSAS